MPRTCQLRPGTRLQLGYGTTVGLFGMTCFRPDLPQRGILSGEGRHFPVMENASGCLPASMDPARLGDSRRPTASQAHRITAAQGSMADGGVSLGSQMGLLESGTRDGGRAHWLWEEQPGLCPGSPEQILAQEEQPPPVRKTVFLHVSSSGREDTVIIFIQSLKQVTWPARGKSTEIRGDLSLGDNFMGRKK